VVSNDMMVPLLSSFFVSFNHYLASFFVQKIIPRDRFTKKQGSLSHRDWPINDLLATNEHIENFLLLLNIFFLTEKKTVHVDLHGTNKYDILQ